MLAIMGGNWLLWLVCFCLHTYNNEQQKSPSTNNKQVHLNCSISNPTGDSTTQTVMVKDRKPYTKGGHRDKWTMEEHIRFLEAIGLYGRGWRQIQVHVGTKTTTQIRSHAQKHFDNKKRGIGSNTDDSIDRVEIPPPRPKRKSDHPYPTNAVSSRKDEEIPKHIQIKGKEAIIYPLCDDAFKASDSQGLNQGTHLLHQRNEEHIAASDILEENHSSRVSLASCSTDGDNNSYVPIQEGRDFVAEPLKTIKILGKAIVVEQKPVSNSVGLGILVNNACSQTCDTVLEKRKENALLAPDPKQIFISGAEASNNTSVWRAPAQNPKLGNQVLTKTNFKKPYMT